jgi:hypothetical protein
MVKGRQEGRGGEGRGGEGRGEHDEKARRLTWHVCASTAYHSS